MAYVQQGNYNPEISNLSRETGGNLANVKTNSDTMVSSLSTLNAKDFSTENTLSGIKTTTDKFQFDINEYLKVNIVAGGAGNGSILDGVDTDIKASVLDYTNSNPLAVRLTDVNGDYVGAGAGTQYSDGDVNADPTGTVAMGTDGANVFALLTDASGHLQVDVLTMPTVAVTGTFWQATQPVSAASLPLPSGAATSALQLPDGHNVTVDNGVSAAAVNIQDGGNSITVDGTVAVTNAGITSIDGKITACNTGAVVVSSGAITETNSGAIKTAVEALDNAISGSEIQVDVVAALPAGTNALGKLLPPDVDVTTHTNYIRKYYTNAGAVTDGIIWSPAAGKRWHITDIYIQVSAAATVTLEDDKAGGDDPVWKGEIAANSGWSHHFDPMYPMASGEDAADLIITTSAANVYCTVVGYEI